MRGRGCHLSRWIVTACVVLTGCRSLYYAAYEKIGVEKRHLLRKNVEKAQEEQTEAAQEFKDVLTRIKELTGFDGGKLESAYRKLDRDYDDCSGRAASIRERIAAVNRIGADLFAEWEKELGEITNAGLRVKSEASLRDARRRFAGLQAAMTQAESRLEPVLTQVRDYVLFLKHNLNAAAVGSMQSEVGAIERDVGRLVEDMNRSIQEAQSFLATLE
jgi:F0F1-type ATP synthase membrane subunit b/b'